MYTLYNWIGEKVSSWGKSFLGEKYFNETSFFRILNEVYLTKYVPFFRPSSAILDVKLQFRHCRTSTENHKSDFWVKNCDK